MENYVNRSIERETFNNQKRTIYTRKKRYRNINIPHHTKSLAEVMFENEKEKAINDWRECSVDKINTSWMSKEVWTIHELLIKNKYCNTCLS